MIKRTGEPTDKNIGELWWVDRVPALITRVDYDVMYLPVGSTVEKPIGQAGVFHGPVERPEFE